MIYLMVHNDNKESNNYVHSILDIHYVDALTALLNAFGCIASDGQLY